MRSARLEVLFRRLRQARYEVTSPADPRYNCIAWAAHRADRFWWPDPYFQYFWPESPRDGSLHGFVRVFGSLGYDLCESAKLEPGFEKVAIYTCESQPTHMARQLPSGDWSSKCGRLEDISHRLEGLEDSDYGRVTVIMKRPLPTPHQGTRHANAK